MGKAGRCGPPVALSKCHIADAMVLHDLSQSPRLRSDLACLTTWMPEPWCLSAQHSSDGPGGSRLYEDALLTGEAGY